MLETITPEKIPEQLRKVAQWVIWKNARRGDQITKIPYQVDRDTCASSTDEMTWANFDDAIAAAYGEFQPGFVFTAEDPFCGVDLDGCRDAETGKIADWARAIILEMNSYTEVSPSRTGVKIFIQGALVKNIKWNLDVEAVCEKKPGIELYDRERYFAMTGWRLAGLPERVKPAQGALDALVATCPRKQTVAWTPSDPTEADVVERAAKYISRMPAAVSGQRGHDAIFHVACIAAMGFGLCEADVMGLLAEYNQRCEPPFSQRELEHKAAQALKQGGDKNYLRFATRDEIYAVKTPRYKDPEHEEPPRENHSIDKPVAPAPKMTNLRDATGAYLNRLITCGDKLIETGLPADVDYAIGGGLEFGEMVIMAARPSHGKSANALQAIHHWTASGLPCMFVSEEMSAFALGKRTVQYASGVHREHWATSMSQVEFDCNVHFANRAPCFIVENCRHVDRVAKVVSDAVKKEGVRCVVIDYAQLLDAAGRGRYEKITNVSIVLRQLFNETQAVGMVLAQLSREIEKRDTFLPRMSDLKETGQLEQDADVIIMSVWPWKVNESEDKNRYQFFVAKVRNREINKQLVDCRFEPARQMLLEQMAPHETEVRDWNDP